MNRTEARKALDILADDVSALIKEKTYDILAAMEAQTKIDGDDIAFSVSLGGVIKRDPDFGRLAVETKIGWTIKEKHSSTTLVRDEPTLFDGVDLIMNVDNVQERKVDDE